MGFFGFLNHWWNFPFLVMLLLVALYLIMQMIGMVGGGDADKEVDHHIDKEVDPDVEKEVDHHVDGAHDAWSDILAFFGVGRVPFMVVWVTLFIFAGFSGLLLNRVMFLSRDGAYPGWFFLIVLLTAFVIGLIGVRFFSRMAARLVDTGGKGSTSKKELTGRAGVVASFTVDDKYGEIRVHDGASEIMVHGRVQDGEPALKRGDKVVLVDYDGEKDIFWVTASPDAEAQG